MRNTGATTMMNYGTPEQDDSFTQAKDGLLWHFTKTEALLPILKNGIRATHSTCLSDKLDGALRNRAQQIMCNILAACHASEGTEDTAKMVREKLPGFFKKDVINPAFISCFTINPDFEKMWERYCSNGGIALGIKKEALIQKQGESKNGVKFLLRRCNYHKWEALSREVQTKEDRIKEALELLECLKCPDSCNVSGRYYKMLGNEWPKIKNMGEELLFAKRRIFEFENEVRLAQIIETGSLEVHPDLQQDGAKLFFHVKLGDSPSDWVGAIRVSPYGDAEGNYAKVLVISRLFNIPLEIVTKDELPKC